MKKAILAVVITVLSALLIFAIAVGVWGYLFPSVKGNTYVFYDLKFKYTAPLTDEEKANVVTNVGYFKNEIKEENWQLKFNDDGTSVLSKKTEDDQILYYVQDNKTVYVFSTKEAAEANDISKAVNVFRLNGNKLEWDEDDDEVLLTLILKKK